MEFEPVCVLHGFASLHTDQDIMSLGIVFTKIVAVVGRHHRDAELFFQAEEIGVDPVFQLKALVLYLEKKVLLAEDVTKESGRFARGFVLPFRQPLCHLPFQASRERDQALRMLSQKLFADARLVVKAVQRRLGGDLDEIAEALIGFGQDAKMVVAIALRRSAMIIFLTDVELATKDGLDARTLSGIVEMRCAKNIAMIGDRYRRHVQRFGASDQLFNIAGPIEQRVISVQMKVNELGH